MDPLCQFDCLFAFAEMCRSYCVIGNKFKIHFYKFSGNYNLLACDNECPYCDMALYHDPLGGFELSERIIG